MNRSIDGSSTLKMGRRHHRQVAYIGIRVAYAEIYRFIQEHELSEYCVFLYVIVKLLGVTD